MKSQERNEPAPTPSTCWPPSSPTRATQKLVARTLEVRGQLQLATGRTEAALDTWAQATERYRDLDDRESFVRSRIHQSQALQSLGLYRQAIDMLDAAREDLEAELDDRLKARGLQSLGDALRVVGQFDRSEAALQQSVAVAERIEEATGDTEFIASALVGLGNTSRARREFQEAINYYREASFYAKDSRTLAQAQLNEFSLLVRNGQWQEAEALLPEVRKGVDRVPLSRDAAYARINLAQTLLESERALLPPAEVGTLLAQAVRQGEELQDVRARSYALGTLGNLYERAARWSDARSLTEQALLLAQSASAADIAYQWQWQLGRVLAGQEDRDSAIAAYQGAVDTLQTLRADLVAVSSEAQFDFREKVEPVYRELVSLLLPRDKAASQADLVQARGIVESLQLAELDNFFKDACLDAQPVEIDRVDASAAIVYPILLGDRLEVIAALPDRPLLRYSTAVSETEIDETVSSMRNALTNNLLRRVIGRFLTPSQKIYDWLVRPIEAELAESGTETMVFVLDGSLRNAPISSLHDGDRYLIEKYAVALTPGLQLLDPQPIAFEDANILTVGLSEGRQGFAPLPGVEFELERIGERVSAEILLNDSFTKTSFKEEVASTPFQVVHVATHGEFSSNAEDTFILTWDDRLTARELDSLLRADDRQGPPIELLVLSACKTATGDDRAALGLAGVAVRAGARSTMASLWYVSDEATATLMTQFYESFTQERLTKAEALRRAQLEILQSDNFSHPYYWSAFVLVGNWL